MTRLLYAEWIKLRSVRSTYLTFGLTLLISVGGGAAIAASVGTAVKDGHWYGVYDPTAASFYALPFAQLALAVGGVLAASSEYATGTIRTSLTAVPRRGRFLAAKAMVFTLVALAVCETTTFCCFFVAQCLLAANAAHAALGQPHVAQAIIGTGIDLTLIGLLGLALGSLLRHAVPAIAVIVVLLFIPYEALDALPTWLQKYLPTLAWNQISNVIPAPHALPAWIGLGLMAAFTAAVLTAALIRLCTQDA
ncbi:MAG TPA: ABC transporter permease [Candidatus Dormibacteraeota bacterium]|nr:ABC transporter permease [Candidatus Dormibacteraeota bacterium]